VTYFIFLGDGGASKRSGPEVDYCSYPTLSTGLVHVESDWPKFKAVDRYWRRGSWREAVCPLGFSRCSYRVWGALLAELP